MDLDELHGEDSNSNFAEVFHKNTLKTAYGEDVCEYNFKDLN